MTTVRLNRLAPKIQALGCSIAQIHLRNLAMIVLAVIAVFSFVACNDNPPPTVKPTAGGSSSITAGRPSGPVCGGLSNFRCPNWAYCDLGAECGGLDREGVCAPRPRECPNETRNVCGCDEKTYSSPCYAAASGVTVKFTGPCSIASASAGSR